MPNFGDFYCMNRHKNMTRGCLLLCFFFISFAALSNNTALAKGNSSHFWVAANDAGLYRGTINNDTGLVKALRTTKHKLNAYFIAKHPSENLIYVAARNGAETDFHVFEINNKYRLVSKYVSKGHPKGVAHISVSPDGNWLAAAYYNSSYIGVYSLIEGGNKIKTHAEIKHQGSSILERQRAPHPHWGGFFERSDIVYFSDLGTDEIYAYKINQNNIELVQKLGVGKGTGPRHLAFHSSLSQLYVSDEFKASVSRFEVDKGTGQLGYIDSTKATPAAQKEMWFNASDIRVHPNNKFLYLVNRGFDQVTAFSIEPKSGKLSFIENEPVRGSISRHINFTSDGKWALVLGKQSNTLAVFKVDQDTGELIFNKPVYNVATPMALVFK